MPPVTEVSDDVEPVPAEVPLAESVPSDVVGVPVVGCVAKYDFRAVEPQFPNDLSHIFRRIDEKTVRDIQLPSKGGAQNICRGFGLLSAQFRRPARTEFAHAEVKQSERISEGVLTEQGAGSAQLYIIRVNTNRKNVYFHC